MVHAYCNGKKKNIYPLTLHFISMPSDIVGDLSPLHYSKSVTISNIKVIYVSLFCFFFFFNKTDLVLGVRNL